MNLYSSKEMTDLLERHDFFFKKNLGQNFLMNESVAARIADTSRETVPENEKCLAIEIGPGAGSLTLQLAHRFDAVLALEIDPHLIGVLAESLAEEKNVKVVHTDALAFDFSSVKTEYPDFGIAVCSNLPYYITSDYYETFGKRPEHYLHHGINSKRGRRSTDLQARKRAIRSDYCRRRLLCQSGKDVYRRPRQLYSASQGRFRGAAPDPLQGASDQGKRSKDVFPFDPRSLRQPQKDTLQCTVLRFEGSLFQGADPFGAGRSRY